MKKRYTSKAYRAYKEAASPSLGEVMASMLYSKSRHVGFMARLNSNPADPAPKAPVKDIEPLSRPEPYNRKRDYVRLLEEATQSPQYAQRQKEKDSLRNLRPATTLNNGTRVKIPMRQRVISLIENFAVFDEAHIGVKAGQPLSYGAFNNIPKTQGFSTPIRADKLGTAPQKFDHALWRERMTSKGCVPPRGRKQLEHLVRRVIVHQALVEQFVASGLTLNMEKCNDESKV